MNILRKFYIAAAVCAAALSGCSAPAAAETVQFPDVISVESARQNVITVNSSEEVKVTPDMAQISFGVSTQTEDAKSCQEQNNEDLGRVIQFLKDSGIPDESLQTSSYGMNPVYDYSSGRTPVGYEMHASITVSDITIDQTGSLLGACVERGINNIESVSYLSSRYEECYQEALAKAVESARIKARVLAEAGGCVLGSVIRVEEQSSSHTARYDSSFTARSNSGIMGADMVMEPGQVSIEAQVLVEFAIE